MRIFVAAICGKALKEEVLKVCCKIPLNVRWIPSENLHLTLLPPWEADESGVKAIIEKLRNIGVQPISIVFKSVSFGPSRKEPRLIWMTADPSEELSGLKSSIEALLGIKSTGRDHIPHITIARFRPELFSSFAVKDLKIEINLEMKIKGFALMRSTLTKEGAVYTTIQEFR